jgi:hypothetical protein
LRDRSGPGNGAHKSANLPLDGIQQEFYVLKQRKRWDMAELGRAEGAEFDRPKPSEGSESETGRPNAAQRSYLLRGLSQAGGKLPLFDRDGQHVHPALVRACIAHGWAAPWFGNPLKPDWLVCKLTEKGRRALSEG